MTKPTPTTIIINGNTEDVQESAVGTITAARWFPSMKQALEFSYKYACDAVPGFKELVVEAVWNEANNIEKRYILSRFLRIAFLRDEGE